MAIKLSRALVATSALAAMNLLTGQNGCPPGGGEDDGFHFATNPISDYERIDRMGMPAVNTALIASGNKDNYNFADPSEDVAGAFVSDIVGSIGFLHGALDDDLASLGLTPCTAGAEGSCVAQGAPLVLPDVLTINVGSPSGFPNGRRLADPVIDVTLAVLLLDLSVHPATTFAGLPLNPPTNDVPFGTIFPYLATPH